MIMNQKDLTNLHNHQMIIAPSNTRDSILSNPSVNKL
jgi:hypothetical protein